jgi:hypothetical protein
MSPNDDVQEELPLVEGEVVKVFEVDEDGFARGENAAGRTGWMPSNFLEQISRDTAMSFLNQGTASAPNAGVLAPPTDVTLRDLTQDKITLTWTLPEVSRLVCSWR